MDVQPGDRFMLCSDGLHGYVEDGEIHSFMQGDRQSVVTQLIDMANDRGGRDNITVVVCDIE